MLKHSLFSDFYLSRRHNVTDDSSRMPIVEGSLAVNADRQRGKKLVLCRANSRTWWESGWQNRR